MGFLDWLRGAPQQVVVAEDRIWLTRQAKLAGIQREITAATGNLQGPDTLLVVAHFQDCLEELSSAIKNSGGDANRVHVTLADDLQHRPAPSAAANEATRVWILAAERHPLPCHDEYVLEFARSLACQCRVVFHVSLEDPLMQLFSGDWVHGVLRQLGAREDQPIESRMVGRRITQAQRNIAARATGDLRAKSCQEWFERNYPKSGGSR